MKSPRPSFTELFSGGGKRRFLCLGGAVSGERGEGAGEVCADRATAELVEEGSSTFADADERSGSLGETGGGGATSELVVSIAEASASGSGWASSNAELVGDISSCCMLENASGDGGLYD